MRRLTQWSNADDLLDAALALPPEARHEYVQRAAGADAELAAALESVLREAERDDGFLDPGGALSGSLGEEIGRELVDDTPHPDALAPGVRFDRYEIVELVGRGGMGEVYRAVDTRLKREVALKVLPDRFAGNPERMARFGREARVLATLSHPGIAAIYGLEEHDGIDAIALELVPGPTLAERLNLDKRPMRVSHALEIGRRLAEALTAAHDRGIVHRDLKPANIKICPDGTVKILDFGLAKALDSSAAEPEPALTDEYPSLLLGTPAYMSPEQARGEPVDERADIWAFGCVLFEMLTGARAFAGDSRADVLGRVMERDPPFDLLPPDLPESIRRLLRRCLAKNPRQRLGYIGDAVLEFDDASSPSTPGAPKRNRWSVPLLVSAGAIAGIAATALLMPREPGTPAEVSRLSVVMPPGDRPVTSFQPSVALSPDGRRLVYRARRGDSSWLFTRTLEQSDAAPIPGTENATGPFFSPDGKWLGFDADGVLTRLSLDGGPPSAICPAPGGVTAHWGRDDTIVFATNTGRVLQRVAASGGTPTPLTQLDSTSGDILHLLPQQLPGGDILFTIVRGAERHVAVLRDGAATPEILVEGTHGRYVPSGHLVFVRNGSLWGARFNAERLEILGEAVPVVTGIEVTDNTVVHYAVATDGSLAYLPESSDTAVRRFVWVDRVGRQTPVDLEPRGYLRASLAADGRLALALADRGNTDVWIADPARRTFSRLTFEPSIETAPVWTPDARFVAFRSERAGPGIFRRSADGTGAVERLTRTAGPIHSPYSWTPDGRTLLLAVFRSFRHQAIASVTPPDPEVRILLDGNFAQLDPHVSADGRWMAYQSDESGRFEIYVRPYPAVDGGRWQISTAGGTSPRWNPVGNELFYFDRGALYAVQLRTSPGFSVSPPRRLAAISPFGGRLGPGYEVAPDGRRFLFLLDAPAPAPTAQGRVVIVRNWIEELRTRLDSR